MDHISQLSLMAESSKLKRTNAMSLPYRIDDGMQRDDGLNLRNCGYAILLILSYVTLVLVIGTSIAGHY